MNFGASVPGQIKNKKWNYFINFVQLHTGLGLLS